MNISFVFSADVVIICFSVTNIRTLNQVEKHWMTEVKRFCPGIPIVLCACQIDLRYLFKDPCYIELEKGEFHSVCICYQLTILFFDSTRLTYLLSHSVFLNLTWSLDKKFREHSISTLAVSVLYWIPWTRCYEAPNNQHSTDYFCFDSVLPWEVKLWRL